MTEIDDTGPEQIRIPLSLTDIPSHSRFVRPPPEELFHYTSLDGAKSLHLTKVAYLNDRSELGFANHLFQSAAQRLQPNVNGTDRKAWQRGEGRLLDARRPG